MAPTTEAPTSPTDSSIDDTVELISETEAAKRLGVIPATLRTWRVKGLLADGLVTETASPAPNGRPRIRYDANWITQANGHAATRSVFAATDDDA
jgi:predicted ArsR family transcriptional regulator